jgi:hypothetical protein
MPFDAGSWRKRFSIPVTTSAASCPIHVYDTAVAPARCGYSAFGQGAVGN